MDYNIINYIGDLEYVRYSLRNAYYKQICEVKKWYLNFFMVHHGTGR